MLVNAQGHDAYCYTGGKPFDTTLPTVVFIHGAQNDHSVWILQTRYFAHHGWSVLAVDLPGHGRSQGAPLTTIEAMSDWLLALLFAAGVSKALLIGHSMGSLIALETAARTYSSLTDSTDITISAIAMVGSAYPMKVSEALLDAANTDQPVATEMVNKWSHTGFVQKPSSPGPGFYVLGGSQRLMERMTQLDQRNPAKQADADSVFHSDFVACNSYQSGEAAAQRIRCPTLFLLGKRDVMTPPKAATMLMNAMPEAKVTLIDSGHALMAEQPDAVLDHLFSFATSVE